MIFGFFFNGNGKKKIYLFFFSLFKKGKIFRTGRVSGARCDKKRERERASIIYVFIDVIYARARSRGIIYYPHISIKKRETIAFKKPAARRGQLCKCCVYAKYSRHSDYIQHRTSVAGAAASWLTQTVR